MYSQCGSISPQTLKELIEYMVGYIVVAFLDTFWKNPQWVAQAHDGYIVIKIVKVATHCFGVFFVKAISMYSLFTLWSKWWIHFKKTQHISTGFWLDKLLKKSQLNHNVSTDYIPPCPQWKWVGATQEACWKLTVTFFNARLPWVQCHVVTC